MILLQQPGAGTYVDYDFYRKFESFEQTIKTAYAEVLQGMGHLGDTASAIAGLAASLYIGFRVLRHLAYAEGVDVWPLLRPFALGFLILNFTIVTDFLGALIKPLEVTTQSMVDIQTTRIQQLENLRVQKMEERMKELDQKIDDLSYWQIGQYLQLLIEQQKVYFNEGLDTFLKNFFYALFLAARLVIMTVRAFFLLILSVVGPLAFAIAIFSGFQDSHLLWIARYVQIMLWLPLANVLGTIVGYLQGKVISLQYLELVNNVPSEAQSGSFIYIVFMVIATLSYFTIPTLSSYIISSSGMAGALQRITNLGSTIAMATMHPTTGQMAAGAVRGMGAAGNVVLDGGKMVVGAGMMAGQAAASKVQQIRNISRQTSNQP
ncbi:conjugative transposon protein TraJ [Nibrella saemangeumensis]|uniref:Conjugative transposon protein TraJ n=1 Tax=Nibrella saemangeumensis TaxID=1084526 RepID=A0ABP8NC90_9BACT